MMKFRVIDRDIAEAVLAKMKNHKWYMTQKVVPFALFSSMIDKQNLATKKNSVYRETPKLQTG